MQTLLLVYVGGGILLALISLPLMAGKVKPNPFYGFRVRATLENPDVWYAVNKHFAQRQLVVALLEVLASVGLYFVPEISVDGYAFSVLGVFVVISAIAFVQSWKYMKSIR